MKETKIDWEQRRYEIAKEMLPITSEWKDAYGNRLMIIESINNAISYADKLMEYLKE